MNLCTSPNAADLRLKELIQQAAEKELIVAAEVGFGNGNGCGG